MTIVHNHEEVAGHALGHASRCIPPEHGILPLQPRLHLEEPNSSDFCYNQGKATIHYYCICRNRYLTTGCDTGYDGTPPHTVYGNSDDSNQSPHKAAVLCCVL